MSGDWDGIILGTGHNALVLQAYLARCGLRVLSLDRAMVPGGGLATVENPRLPGFRHNTHSFFHRAVTMMPWYRDLELLRHGAVYLEPELNVALILPDGRSLEWWTDFDKTVDSFAEFSLRDAATLTALGRGVPADRRAHHPARSAVTALAARAPERAVATLGPGAAVPGGLGAHAPGIRPGGIRARSCPRRTAVLQRHARDRLAGTRIRPLDRSDSRWSPQGPDVPGRIDQDGGGAGRGHPGPRGRDPHRRSSPRRS